MRGEVRERAINPPSGARLCIESVLLAFFVKVSYVEFNVEKSTVAHSQLRPMLNFAFKVAGSSRAPKFTCKLTECRQLSLWANNSRFETSCSNLKAYMSVESSYFF